MVEPVVIAMSSAFNPFPAQCRRPAAAQDRRLRHRRGRERRRRDRDRPPGHRWMPCHHDSAVRQCRPRRRGQGSRSGAAAGLRRARIEAAWSCANGAAKANVESDRHLRPAKSGRRRGSRAASRQRSRRSAAAAILRFRRRPAIGFSGAAARDDGGKFAGIALLKPAVVAGPPKPRPRRSRCWCRPKRCANFLKANGVTRSGGRRMPSRVRGAGDLREEVINVALSGYSSITSDTSGTRRSNGRSG